MGHEMYISYIRKVIDNLLWAMELFSCTSYGNLANGCLTYVNFTMMQLSLGVSGADLEIFGGGFSILWNCNFVLAAS